MAQATWEHHDLHTRLTRAIKGQVCAACGGLPSVRAWRSEDGSPVTWRIWCPACKKEPALTKQPHIVAERMAQMVERSLAQRPQTMPLTLQEIQKFISPKATEKEAYIFLRFCQAEQVNPFTGEAYLIKYDEASPASIVLGLATYLKRASRHPQFQGYQSGIIVRREKGVEELEGSFAWPSDEILGGWARVHRAGWEAPLMRRVKLSEYDTGKALWKSKPATMIEKVAIAQGLRRAFPEQYEAAEGLSVVVEGEAEGETVEPAPTARATPSAPMVCPIHNVRWFKAGKMPDYAHKIEGATGPRGGAVWCNREEVLSRAGRETSPQRPQDAPEQAPGPDEMAEAMQGADDPFEGKIFENKGEALNWARSKGLDWTRDIQQHLQRSLTDATVAELTEAIRKALEKGQEMRGE